MDVSMKRTLKLGIGRETVDVTVQVFWPKEEERAWSCDWQIDWPDRRRTNSGHGVDAIQALLGALQMIGAEINCSDERKSGKLTWGHDWSGYGFPVPNGIRDVLAGDDATYF